MVHPPGRHPLVPREDVVYPPNDFVLGRRRFLIGSGVLGAGALAALHGSAAFASALTAAPADTLSPLLETLALDTMSGLVAFVVPGPDAFSTAQGSTNPQPGGIAAGGARFMLAALDDFFPLPEEYIRLLVAALATGTSSASGVPVLGSVLGAVVPLSEQIDEALGPILQGQGSAPLSLPIAMLLNTVAASVDPASVSGPYLDSPFANLRVRNKGEVFRRMEEDTASVAALLDDNLPAPLHDSLSGVVAFVAGALLEFSAFGSFSEWDVLDPATRKLTAVPVGWRNSQYLAATGFRTVDGWNDFQGYYQGRKKVTE